MQKQIFPIFGLILFGGLLLNGCHGEPYWNYYTRSKPQVKDLIGDYVLAEQTLNEQPIKDLQAKNGTRASVSKISLRADGTFLAVNVPEWAKDDLHQRSITKFKSGYGKWSFESGPAASNDNTIFWSLAFTSSNVDLSTFYPNLLENKAPYAIVFNYAEDPDQDEAMIFRKAE